MKYRAEIDGLRAVAVIPVILYHAGFELFSGGFVGVDVFFVISGYLITTIIHDEIKTRTFSIAHFYERRARRILPALLFICLLCIPFAWLWMLPAAFKDFGQSLVAVNLFSSNILFARESGYFVAAAELKPLLHTWSLAVEEQFYLFFPLILLAFRRFRDATLLGILAVISLLSLALAEFASHAYPTANFYLLVTRAWELGVGALLAIVMPYMRRPGAFLEQGLPILGLLLVGFAVFYFDASLPFPGVWGLIPVLGTALIIAYTRPTTLVASILSLKPVVTIGLLSYSAYLWHQPLFAFARLTRVDSTPVYLLLSASSIVLAYFTWRFIEAPFRNRRNFSRRQILGMSLSAAAILMAVGATISFKDGFDYRYNEQQQSLLAFGDYDYAGAYREGECFLYTEQSFEAYQADCFASAEKQNVVAIWGDSQAAALSFGLRERVPHFTQLTASACPPLLNYRKKARPNCREINDFALRKLGELKPERIVLHASWKSEYGRQSGSLEDLLVNTLSRLKRATPGSEIIVLGNSPQWRPSLPEQMVAARLSLEARAVLEPSAYAEFQAIDERVRKIAGNAGVSYISILERYCVQQGCLTSLEYAGQLEPFVWDRRHLTRASSREIANNILDR